MKLKLRNLALMFGGAAAGLTGTQLAHGETAHAAVRTTSVKVHKGDTTWGIAKKHKTSVKKIVQENHLKDNGNKIYEDQVLKVENGKKFKDDLHPTKKAAPAKTNLSFSTTRATENTDGVVTPTAYKYSASTPASTATGSEASAKAWIAAHESSGRYNAQNGRYYGKYQLDLSYLHGDLSPANQEKTADNYVKGRYGSWANAKAHWLANNWY